VYPDKYRVWDMYVEYENLSAGNSIQLDGVPVV